MTLSILIIAHNQREYLKRCVESVLKQKLPFSYEIIISDDHSTDGTWELIEDYCKCYTQIQGVHCEMDYMNPICNSERCGLNKLNAYLHSSGKYFVNLDADDYLVGTDVYKRQWELLEAHPECSMCQHCVLHVNDGEPLEDGFSYFADIPTGTIYHNAYLVANNNMLDINQGFMIRRNPDVDMKVKLGKYFNDRSITYLHLLYGHCIYLNAFGYVYVMYNSAISNYSGYTREELAIKQSADILTRIQLIPEWAGVFMRHCGIRAVANIFRYRNSKVTLTNNKKMTYREFRGFTFDYFLKEKRSFVEHLRALCLRWLFYVIRKLNFNTGAGFYKCLYALATSKQEANKIPMTYWANNQIEER